MTKAQFALRSSFLAAAISVGGCVSGPVQPDRGPVAPDAPAGQVTEVPIGSFVVGWRAQLNTPATRLELSDEKVFVYNRDNQVYWVDRGTGVLSSITTPGRPENRLFAPAVLKDRVVFPASTQLAVYTSNGRLIYTADLHYSASSGAVGQNDDIFLGVDHPRGGWVESISVTSQSYDENKRRQYQVPPNWDLMTMGSVRSRPALFGGDLFVGSSDGGVYAVRAADREVLWPALPRGFFQTGGPVLADMKADKDGVYAASMDSKLYCLDANTGRIKWTYYAGVPLDETVQVVPLGTLVFVTVPGAGVVCLEKTGHAETRNPKWTVQEGRQFLASDDQYVYLRTRENRIIGVEKATGQVRMRAQRPDLAVFATNTSAKEPGTIIAATAAGTVYAIRPVLKPGVVGEWAFAE